MIDILLLAGVALCVLSVLAAILSVARTRAPRGAALLLVLGIALGFAGAWLDQRPFGVESLEESWDRLVKGEIALAPAPAPAPAPEAAAPAAEAPAAEAPAAEPVAEPAAPAAEAPAAEAPAAEAPAAEPAAEPAPAEAPAAEPAAPAASQ